MKKSKKNLIAESNHYLIIYKPKDESGKLLISAESIAKEKTIAVIEILSQVFDYFETQKLLSEETISDLRYLIEEYMEANMASFEYDVSCYLDDIDIENNFDDYEL